MAHVVLLGDSILDNASYVQGGASVIQHVTRQLPDGWKATLEAVDGSVTEDVHHQLSRIPVDASHLVLSVGGNDGLNNIDIIDERVSSTAETLHRLAGVARGFEDAYRRLVSALLELDRPLAVCTVYYPNFEDPRSQQLAVTALTVFNDAILRVAFEHRLVAIDLRLICNCPADYANPIEPSAEGGRKIARGIMGALNVMQKPVGSSVVIVQ